MGRLDDLRARHDAELAVVELEDALLAAKDSGQVPQELKEALREARRVHRELRAGEAAPSPAVIAAAAVAAPGGGQ